MKEPRAAERRRAFLGGMIVSCDGMQSLSCTIRNISDGGARIALPRDTIVPARFYLLTSRQAVGHEAQIVWRTATQAGLKFHAEQKLSPAMNTELLFLWRLFLALGLRATAPFDF